MPGQGRHGFVRGSDGATARTFLRTLLASAAMGFAAIIAVGAAMWTVFQLDHGDVRAAVRDAFAERTMIANSGQLLDLHRGDYIFNDCLILQSLLLARDDWRHSVIEATIYVADDPCKILEEDAAGQRPTASTYGYSRYVFAARAVSAPLVASFGVERTKQGLRIANYLVIVLAALVSLLGLSARVQPRHHAPTLYLAALIFAVALLVLYRLPYYAQTLAHGFSELVIAGYLLYMVLPGKRRRDEGVPMAAVVLGVLTGCFELLTGPLLVAVGMAVLLDHSAAPTRSHPYRRALLVAFGCIAGTLMVLFWQQAIISVLSDARPFHDFATHLAIRLQLHQYFAIAIDPRWAIAENMHLYSPGEVAAAIAQALPTLTYGSTIAAQVVFAGSAVIAGSSVALAPRESRPGCVIAAAVALSLPAWYFAFANHTVLHSLYMIRMAVLLPACAGIALTFALAPFRKRKAPRTRGVSRGRETPAAKGPRHGHPLREESGRRFTVCRF